MNSDQEFNWKITVVEHCVFMQVGRGQSFYGAHNQKNADLAADQPGNITIIQGYGHNILVDTGFGNEEFIKAYNCGHMLTPEEYLAPVGLKTRDIDTILVSHMHYDHVGYIARYPQAKVYVQETEYKGWKHADILPERYQLLKCYLDPETLKEFAQIEKEGRLVLAKDNCEVYPGITLHLTPGHSYGTQSAVVQTKKGPFVVCGDSAYTLENIETMTPMGYGFSQIDMLKSFDKIMELADGAINRVIPGHDLSWPDKFSNTYSLTDKFNRITCVTD